MTRTLVAGATGYLGRHLVAQLHHRGHTVRALVRNRARAERAGTWGAPSLAGMVDEWAVGEVTDSAFTTDIASGVDNVVSALGVTTQRGDPWQIDYRGNLAVLESAERNGVRAYCFANVIGADECPAQLTRAKAAFAARLAQSRVPGQIINPPGYFSDMMQVFGMARRGRVYLFDPDRTINPIHGADLAAACVARLESGDDGSWDVGGPDIFTWRQLAECAFTTLDKPTRITRIPSAVLPPIQAVAQLVSPRRADTLRFITWGMLHDTVGQPTGTHHLADFFAAQAAAPAR